MANLKQDLLNNLGNKKYYDELELVRLAQEPNMVYKEKIDLMSELLRELALSDLSQQLVGKYFPDAPPAPAPVSEDAQQIVAPEQPVDAKPHQGQTHGE